MPKNTKHQGIIVPTVTPTTSGGALDEKAAAGLVDRLARHGLGVFVLGTTGEAASVPAEVRRRWVEVAVESAAGRVPVYAGIGANCVADTIEAGNAYLELGVDAAVAHLPYYYMLSAAEMQAYFELLADSINGPIIIYNIPSTTHMSIPVEVIEHLAERQSVVGCKDSERCLERMDAMADRLGGRKNFSLFMGIAAFSVRALQRGFDGLVPSSGNLAPEWWEQLDAAAAAGDWKRAEALQERVDAVARVFQHDRTLGQSLAALKAAMSVRGFCQPEVLPPLQRLDETAIATIADELAALGLQPLDSAPLASR